MAKKIALIYFIVGCIWITTSDYFLKLLENTEVRTVIDLQMMKGWLFIFTTALLLYILIRKFIEKEREVVDEFLRLFFDNPTPMLVYDKDSQTVIESNNAAQKFYGYTKEELNGLDVSILFDSEYHYQLVELQKQIVNKPNLSTLSRHVNKDGVKKYVRLNGHPFRVRNKNSRLVLIWDVDKEHKAELKNTNLNQKIAKRERYLDSILQAQSTYLVRTDLKGIIRFANQTFSRKDGVDPASLIGRSIGSEVFADDREKLKALLDQCLQHPEEICADLIRFQWNGTTRFVEWEFKGIQDDEGTIREFQGVGIDRTERMNYLKEISEYKQRLDNILSSVNEIVWSSDAETYELNYINKATLTIFGYESSYFYSDPKFLFKIISEEDHAAFLAFIDKIKNTGSAELDYRIKTSTGEIRHMYSSANLATSISGRQIIIGTITDMTSQKEYQLKIEAQNRQLKEIAWIQSHDIRKPLANILGLIDLLKSNDVSKEELQDVFQKMDTEAQELDAKIHAIIQKTYNL